MFGSTLGLCQPEYINLVYIIDAFYFGEKTIVYQQNNQATKIDFSTPTHTWFWAEFSELLWVDFILISLAHFSY